MVKMVVLVIETRLKLRLSQLCFAASDSTTRTSLHKISAWKRLDVGKKGYWKA